VVDQVLDVVLADLLRLALTELIAHAPERILIVPAGVGALPAGRTLQVRVDDLVDRRLRRLHVLPGCRLVTDPVVFLAGLALLVERHGLLLPLAGLRIAAEVDDEAVPLTPVCPGSSAARTTGRVPAAKLGECPK